MNIRLHKSLLAGAIAAVLTTPVWSAGTQSYHEGSQSGASSERYGQSEYGQSQGSSEHQGLSGVGAGTTGMSGTSGTAGSSSLSSGAGATAWANNPLGQKTPEDLEGMKVVDANNEHIGEIDKVVHSRQNDNIFAVISFGGVLGMGEKKVLVPFSDLQQGQNDQQLQISRGKEELKTAQQYDKDQYVELQPEDRPISEFARFESSPGSSRAGQSGTMEQESQSHRYGSEIESGRGQSPSEQESETQE
jgi:hypothetical protein